MKKLSVLETKRQIIQASIERGEDPCVLLAFASIETGGTFNNTAISKNNLFHGVMQLSNGYGGVKGSDRLDPYKATHGAINKMQENRGKVINKFGDIWQPYMIYLTHQQGLVGFFTTWREQHKKISHAKYSGNIRDNSPKSAVYVYDFLNYWKNRFEKLIKECSIECLTTVKGLSGSEDFKEDENHILVSNCIVTTNYGSKSIEKRFTNRRNFFAFYSY